MSVKSTHNDFTTAKTILEKNIRFTKHNILQTWYSKRHLQREDDSFVEYLLLWRLSGCVSILDIQQPECLTVLSSVSQVGITSKHQPFPVSPPPTSMQCFLFCKMLCFDATFILLSNWPGNVCKKWMHVNRNLKLVHFDELLIIAVWCIFLFN